MNSKLFGFIILFFALSFCTESKNNKIRLSYSNDKMKVNLKVNNINYDENKIIGELKVKNVSSDTLFYSNAGLFIINGKDTARVYSDGIASWVGDFASIQIPPADSLILNIYSKMNQMIHRDGEDKIKIDYKHPDSKIYKNGYKSH